MKHLTSLALTINLFAAVASAEREWMIVGIDNKVAFTEEGILKQKPTQDWIYFYDIGGDPAKPQLVHKIPLVNSVFGPPTNLAVNPAGTLAMVANSVNWVEKDGAWEAEPDTLIHIIDLAGDLPEKLGEVHAGAQPSGMAISRDGTFAIVANRKGQSVTLLEIEGKKVTAGQTIEVEGEATAVAIRPDGKQALVTKFAEHAIAVLDIADGKLSYDASRDLPVGRWPYNVQYSSNGKRAYSANNGNAGLPDGHADTISQIETTTDPPRVVEHITVGDGPEGLAVAPKLAAGGLDFVVVPILNGSAPPFKGKWFHQDEGRIDFLEWGAGAGQLWGRSTGRFPEGVGFNKAGTHFYVGDLIDHQISVYAVDEPDAEDVVRLKLPGPPVSLRTQVP